MDAARKKELKKAGKAEIEANEAVIQAMLLESNPAPPGSFADARNYERGQARSRWLERHGPALHADRAQRLCVIAPAPMRHGVTGWHYFRCTGCGSVAPSRPKRNRIYWWACECGNVRLRRIGKWGRYVIRDEALLEAVHIMGRGAPKA